MTTLLDSINQIKSDSDKVNALKRVYSAYESKSYYDVFGVSHPISDDKQRHIKKIYQKCAMQIHPDKVIDEQKPICGDLFALLSSAYATLIDKEKEQSYWLSHSEVPLHREAPRPAQSSATVNMPHSNPMGEYSFFRFRPQSIKRVRGNIPEHKKITLSDDAIIITGDIYGELETHSGDITINGNVYGNVSSFSGKITIHGHVMPSGTVSASSSDIRVSGVMLGIARSALGRVVHIQDTHVAPAFRRINLIDFDSFFNESMSFTNRPFF